MFIQQRKKKQNSSDEDDDLGSGSDIEMHVEVAPRADRPGRRATAKKINYSGLLDSEAEKSSDGELEFRDNEGVKEQSHQVIQISDNEDGSDDDQANGSNPPIVSDSDATPIKKKSTAKRPRKKAMTSDSDSDKKVRSYTDFTAEFIR